MAEVVELLSIGWNLVSDNIFDWILLWKSKKKWRLYKKDLELPKQYADRKRRPIELQVLIMFILKLIPLEVLKDFKRRVN